MKDLNLQCKLSKHFFDTLQIKLADNHDSEGFDPSIIYGKQAVYYQEETDAAEFKAQFKALFDGFSGLIYTHLNPNENDVTATTEAVNTVKTQLFSNYYTERTASIYFAKIQFERLFLLLCSDNDMGSDPLKQDILSSFRTELNVCPDGMLTHIDKKIDQLSCHKNHYSLWRKTLKDILSHLSQEFINLRYPVTNGMHLHAINFFATQLFAHLSHKIYKTSFALEDKSYLPQNTQSFFELKNDKYLYIIEKDISSLYLNLDTFFKNNSFIEAPFMIESLANQLEQQLTKIKNKYFKDELPLALTVIQHEKEIKNPLYADFEKEIETYRGDLSQSYPALSENLTSHLLFNESYTEIKLDNNFAIELKIGILKQFVKNKFIDPGTEYIIDNHDKTEELHYQAGIAWIENKKSQQKRALDNGFFSDFPNNEPTYFLSLVYYSEYINRHNIPNSTTTIYHEIGIIKNLISSQKLHVLECLIENMGEEYKHLFYNESNNLVISLFNNECNSLKRVIDIFEKLIIKKWINPSILSKPLETHGGINIIYYLSHLYKTMELNDSNPLAIQLNQLVEKLVENHLIEAEALSYMPKEGLNIHVNAIWLMAYSCQWKVLQRLLVNDLIIKEYLYSTPKNGIHEGINALWFMVSKDQWLLLSMLTEKNLLTQDIFLSMPKNKNHVYTGINVVWMIAFKYQWDLLKTLIDKDLLTQDMLSTPNENHVNAGINAAWMIANQNAWDLLKALIDKDLLTQNMLLSAPKNEAHPSAGVNMILIMSYEGKWDLLKTLIDKDLLTQDMLLSMPKKETPSNAGINVVWIIVYHKMWTLLKSLIDKDLLTQDMLLSAPKDQTHPNAGINVVLMMVYYEAWDLLKTLIDKDLLTQDMLLSTPKDQTHPTTGINVTLMMAFEGKWNLLKTLIDKDLLTQDILSSTPKNENHPGTGINVALTMAFKDKWNLLEALIDKDLLTQNMLLSTPQNEIHPGAGINVALMMAFKDKWNLLEVLIDKDLLTQNMLLSTPKNETHPGAGINVALMMTFKDKWNLLEALIDKDLLTQNMLLSTPQNETHPGAGINVILMMACKRKWNLLKTLIDKNLLTQDMLLSIPKKETHPNTGINVAWLMAYHEKWNLLGDLIKKDLLTQTQLLSKPLNKIGLEKNVFHIIAEKNQWNLLKILADKNLINNNHLESITQEKISHIIQATQWHLLLNLIQKGLIDKRLIPSDSAKDLIWVMAVDKSSEEITKRIEQQLIDKHLISQQDVDCIYRQMHIIAREKQEKLNAINSNYCLHFFPSIMDNHSNDNYYDNSEIEQPGDTRERKKCFGSNLSSREDHDLALDEEQKEPVLGKKVKYNG